MNTMEQAGTLLGKIGELGFQLKGATGPQAALLWPAAVPLFQQHRRLWESHESLEQIRMRIMEGYAQLWLLFEGDEPILLMVTKTEVEPSGMQVFIVPYIFGRGLLTEFDVTKLAMEYVENYAVSGGCVLMRAVTFERLAHHLEVFGFETTRHVVEKSIVSSGALN